MWTLVTLAFAASHGSGSVQVLADGELRRHEAPTSLLQDRSADVASLRAFEGEMQQQYKKLPKAAKNPANDDSDPFDPLGVTDMSTDLKHVRIGCARRECETKMYACAQESKGCAKRLKCASHDAHSGNMDQLGQCWHDVSFESMSEPEKDFYACLDKRGCLSEEASSLLGMSLLERRSAPAAPAKPAAAPAAPAAAAAAPAGDTDTQAKLMSLVQGELSIMPADDQVALAAHPMPPGMPTTADGQPDMSQMNKMVAAFSAMPASQGIINALTKSLKWSKAHPELPLAQEEQADAAEMATLSQNGKHDMAAILKNLDVSCAKRACASELEMCMMLEPECQKRLACVSGGSHRSRHNGKFSGCYADVSWKQLGQKELHMFDCVKDSQCLPSADSHQLQAGLAKHKK